MKTGLRLAFSMAIFTSILFVPLLGLGQTTYQSPAISLDPVSGPAGAGVTVWATGFGPDDYATIYWDMYPDNNVGSFNTIKDGSGNGSFYVPSNAIAGTHTVIVITALGKPTQLTKVLKTVPHNMSTILNKAGQFLMVARLVKS